MDYTGPGLSQPTYPSEELCTSYDCETQHVPPVFVSYPLDCCVRQELQSRPKTVSYLIFGLASPYVPLPRKFLADTYLPGT